MHDYKKLFPGYVGANRDLPLQGFLLGALRFEHHEYVYEMANKLGISKSYLSQINRGKKNISPALVPKIVEAYKLSKDQKEALEEAIALYSKEVSINLVDERKSKRLLAVEFAEKFKDISEREAVNVISYLRGIRNEAIQ